MSKEDNTPYFLVCTEYTKILTSRLERSVPLSSKMLTKFVTGPGFKVNWRNLLKKLSKLILVGLNIHAYIPNRLSSSFDREIFK